MNIEPYSLADLRMMARTLNALCDTQPDRPINFCELIFHEGECMIVDQDGYLYTVNDDGRLKDAFTLA